MELSGSRKMLRQALFSHTLREVMQSYRDQVKTAAFGWGVDEQTTDIVAVGLFMLDVRKGVQRKTASGSRYPLRETVEEMSRREKTASWQLTQNVLRLIKMVRQTNAKKGIPELQKLTGLPEKRVIQGLTDEELIKNTLLRKARANDPNRQPQTQVHTPVDTALTGYNVLRKDIPADQIELDLDAQNGLFRGTRVPYRIGQEKKILHTPGATGTPSVEDAEKIKPIPGAEDQTWLTGWPSAAMQSIRKANQGTVTALPPDQVRPHPLQQSSLPEEGQFLHGEFIGKPIEGGKPTIVYQRQNKHLDPHQDRYTLLKPIDGTAVYNQNAAKYGLPKRTEVPPTIDPAEETFAPVWQVAEEMRISPETYHYLAKQFPQQLEQMQKGTLDLNMLQMMMKNKKSTLDMNVESDSDISDEIDLAWEHFLKFTDKKETKYQAFWLAALLQRITR